GAGRFDADLAGTADLADAHLQALHQAGRTAMIQPYLSGVDTAGETALIFLDGQFSHSVCKSAMLPPDSRHPVAGGDLYVAETITARQPSAAELAVADQVLTQLTGGLSEPLLYARIDLLPSPDGPLVVEAELTEPSLFLSYAEGAASRLAEAISARTA
nr:hypothetical protein [Actinomycetota bacterium]